MLQPNTAGTWQDFLAGVRQLGIDYARFRLIDVERSSDDNNVPDQADLRYGLFDQPAVGGLTLGGLVVLAIVLVGGGLLVRQLVK